MLCLQELGTKHELPKHVFLTLCYTKIDNGEIKINHPGMYHRKTEFSPFPIWKETLSKNWYFTFIKPFEKGKSEGFSLTWDKYVECRYLKVKRATCSIDIYFWSLRLPLQVHPYLLVYKWCSTWKYIFFIIAVALPKKHLDRK
jgi:hypothetical protein